MTDIGGSGRFDQVLQQANEAVQDLREKLSAKSAEIGQEINAAVDKIQAALDEIRFSRQEGRPHPDNTLPGDLEEEPQPSGDPNDPSKSGGTPPKPSPKK